MYDAVIRELRVLNKAGVHLRPASQIVKKMHQFKSEVILRREGRTVNAKSIMSVSTLLAPKDTVVTVEAIGPDAEEAVSAMADLFESKFGEE
ncbi:MAG: HPr family phosphocarrier protein [Deltaproteobacteria bacterium]|nr:HPr family phosphocarrier protein [bacterium]MCB9477435.1 HPr family phosphocarrier protein [Deltaproteobacteria bacterium]MCB9478783.1 HPr family phosphocarrier protein [Deltaproteobacteria bacterium]MCB9489055.1 HPr family phosphocarrier protein [Deltaproteobacteria bacterium]